eukprot:gene17948-biopygen22110
MQRRQCVERFNVNALHNEETRNRFAQSIHDMLNDTPAGDDVNQEWKQIAQSLQTAGHDILGKRKPSRCTWQEEFADRLHEMAQERRELAHTHADDPARLRLELRQIRAAHQQETRCFVRGWWKRTLQSMAGPKGGPNMTTIQRLEQAIAPPGNKSTRTELFSADEKMQHRTPAAKQERWREHFESLFAAENNIDLSYVYARTPQRSVLNYLDSEPTDAEVFQAIRELKKNKAAGEDSIVAEMLQMGGASLHERLSFFVRLVWQHGQVPKAWRDAVVVPLPKGGDLRMCDNWRGISLLSVPGKILALVIVKRLTPLAESLLGETANGFRPGRGCEDVVAFVRDLLEQVNASKKGSTLHAIFADLR